MPGGGTKDVSKVIVSRGERHRGADIRNQDEKVRRRGEKEKEG